MRAYHSSNNNKHRHNWYISCWKNSKCCVSSHSCTRCTCNPVTHLPSQLWPGSALAFGSGVRMWRLRWLAFTLSYWPSVDLKQNNFFLYPFLEIPAMGGVHYWGKKTPFWVMHLDAQRVRHDRGEGQGRMKITDRNKTKVDVPRYRFT